jgi:hypothetical protein
MTGSEGHRETKSPAIHTQSQAVKVMVHPGPKKQSQEVQNQTD